MITKLERTFRGFDDTPGLPTGPEFFSKINEIIDVVNSLTEENNEESVDTTFDKVDKAVNKVNEKLDLAYYYKEKLDIAIEALKKISDAQGSTWGVTYIANMALEQVQGEELERTTHSKLREKHLSKVEYDLLKHKDKDTLYIIDQPDRFDNLGFND